MLTLDRVKLIATLDSLISYTPEMFTSVLGGRILSFQTKEPFELSVQIKSREHELVIEFTGKILGEDYSVSYRTSLEEDSDESKLKCALIFTPIFADPL